MAKTTEKVITSKFTDFEADYWNDRKHWRFTRRDVGGRVLDEEWLAPELADAVHLLMAEDEPCDDPDRCACHRAGFKAGVEQGRRP